MWYREKIDNLSLELVKFRTLTKFLSFLLWCLGRMCRSPFIMLTSYLYFILGISPMIFLNFQNKTLLLMPEQEYGIRKNSTKIYDAAAVSELWR